MSVPNIGPGLPEPYHPDGPDPAKKGNPALVYRDERPTDEVAAASTRASYVTHRFGGVRYELTRPSRSGEDGPGADGGESDPQD